jgi:c-di-GMP-related signal transduction protein
MVPPKPDQHRFLGRQAILDQKMDLYGYELLFRVGRVNAFSGDLEDATNQTIACCLSMIACSSYKRLFVNCTRNALVNMSVKLLPSRTVVLEILEDTPADAELVRACKELKRSGFRLARPFVDPSNACWISESTEMRLSSCFIGMFNIRSIIESMPTIYNSAGFSRKTGARDSQKQARSTA